MREKSGSQEIGDNESNVHGKKISKLIVYVKVNYTSRIRHSKYFSKLIVSVPILHM